MRQPLRLRVGLAILVVISCLSSCESIALAQTPFPIEAVLTMAGPASAASSAELTYVVTYRLANPAIYGSTSIAIVVPPHTTYVSASIISGTPGKMSPPEESTAVVRWDGLGSEEQPEGRVQLVVRVESDFVGFIEADAYVPGVVGSSESNLVRTQVFAPGASVAPDALPSTGRFGGKPLDHGYFVPLAVLGLALFAVGLAVKRSTGQS